MYIYFCFLSRKCFYSYVLIIKRYLHIIDNVKKKKLHISNRVENCRIFPINKDRRKMAITQDPRGEIPWDDASGTGNEPVPLVGTSLIIGNLFITFWLIWQLPYLLLVFRMELLKYRLLKYYFYASKASECVSCCSFYPCVQVFCT